MNDAENKANKRANVFQGKAWQMFADVMKAVNGPAIDWGALLRGGTLQFNRVGRTNDAGEFLATPIPITVAGLYNFGQANFNIFAPSDRLRIILNMKLRLVVADDDGVVDGSIPVPDGAHQQLIASGVLEVNRQRGNRVTSNLDSYMSVAPNFRDAPSAALDASANYALPRIPSENEVLPLGFSTHLLTALDGLNKQERCAFSVRGPNLEGVAATGITPGANNLALVPEAMVWDGVLSGQGS